jgi:3-dehydro-L-gulonate 2-dehydrogenase
MSLINANTYLVAKEQMHRLLLEKLLLYDFEQQDAETLATIFTENSIDGIYTHGINRFAKFIEYVKNGYIDTKAKPSLVHAFGSMEQWNGNYGPGPLNALFATDRAMELATANGIGLITLANSNHWLRAGSYGWRAAKKGFAFICWTNTIPNMPAWGATDARLGNNPLVFAMPFNNEAIVLDMAMSQYSFGAMEMSVLKNEHLETMGGYDKDGKLTNNPAAILETRRPLPIGYWKGAGLALLLDLFASVLSGGLSTAEIGRKGIEYCSQVFIAIDISKLAHASSVSNIIQQVIDDYRLSVPENERTTISYPGENVLKTRKINTEYGIPVIKLIWDEIRVL